MSQSLQADRQKSFLTMGQEPPLVLVYEDHALIAVHKPAGQLFHGYTKGAPGPLADQLKAYIKERYQKPGKVYLGVVHRLDRPVSGLCIFARNSKFASRLSEQFQDHSLEKTYLALVEGVPALPEAQLEDTLSFAADEAQETAHDKVCTLSYQVIQTAEQRSLLAIRLGTGRRNQIRRQLALHGLPIVGDVEHGARSLIPGTEALDPRFRPILLHAWRLRLQHPSSFAPLELRTPVPFYWEALGSSWDLSQILLS